MSSHSYPYGPPPQPANTHTNYAHATTGSYSQPGVHRATGAAAGRGRGGGHYASARQEFQGASQGQYDYGGQQQYSAPSHNGFHPAQGYHQQWQPEPGYAAPPSHGHHSSSSMSPSSAGYVASYSPQGYPQGQYSHSPQPAHGHAPQQYAAYPPPSSTPQWNSASQHQYPRPRGGYQNDRGAPKSQAMGPAMRVGFDDGMQAPVSTAYGQGYQDPRASYPPPSYQGFTSHVSSHMPPPPGQHDPYYSSNHRRGRGGFHNGGHHRGKAPFHGDKHRQNHHRKSGQPNDNPQPQRADGSVSGKKKKRKINTLGLTPAGESESEDDEGEEKILTELIGSDAFHVTDIAGYIAERKKNFPTKSRVESKKAAEMAQQQSSEKSTASSLEKQADKLRRQLKKVESSIKRKREQQDEGDEMRDSTSSAGDKSEDGSPEVETSRPTGNTSPSQPKKADISKHCKYFSTGGSCGKKGKCRFVHDPEVRESAMKEKAANNGRLTIQQRLILNDKQQEDLTILKSIQYLREKGVMKSQSTPAGKAKAANGQEPPSSQQTSLLPAASASLPPPPIKREPASHHQQTPPVPNGSSHQHYQGWVLRPYGSGGPPQSDDLP